MLKPSISKCGCAGAVARCPKANPNINEYRPAVVTSNNDHLSLDRTKMRFLIGQIDDHEQLLTERAFLRTRAAHVLIAQQVQDKSNANLQDPLLLDAFEARSASRSSRPRDYMKLPERLCDVGHMGGSVLSGWQEFHRSAEVGGADFFEPHSAKGRPMTYETSCEW